MFLTDRDPPSDWSPSAGVLEEVVWGLEVLKKGSWTAKTLQRIALIALEAECHALVGGSYPATLEELNLDFLPIDSTHPKGGVLDYRLGTNGRPEIRFAPREEGGESGWRF